MILSHYTPKEMDDMIFTLDVCIRELSDKTDAHPIHAKRLKELIRDLKELKAPAE